MSTKVFSYNKASELAGIIQALRTDKNTRFVVPSRKDKFFFPYDGNTERELWTWQEIYEDITKDSDPSQMKKVLSPPDHQLILKYILGRLIYSYTDKTDRLPGIKRPGFLSLLSDDIRELLNEGVTSGQLTHKPESDNPSEFLLPEIYASYLAYLEFYNLLDSAQICTAALDALKANPDWGKELVIVFTGFLSFTHSQLELVESLTGRCPQVIIIKPEANLRGFSDAASQVKSYSGVRESAGRIAEFPVSEPSLEPEVIARKLALWSLGECPELGEWSGYDSVAVMVSQGREDSFAQAFRRYGVPYDFMSGVPISQTLPGKVLASVRTLRTRQFPTYETATLLSQPCFAGKDFPVMRAYRAGRSGLDGWEEYLGGYEEGGQVITDALNSIRAIRKFTESLQRKNTPAEIMGAFHDFLTAPGLWLNREDRLSDNPELDESIRLTASAIETIGDKVMRLRELMPDLGRVQDERLENDDAYEYLEDWCRNTNTRAPVQVSDAVRIFTGQPQVLASFPVWVMTGVTQKTWSGNIQASPLLGAEARSALNENGAHLPGAYEKAQQREALFRRLIHTGEGLTVISRPLLDEEGRPLSESPFMERFREDMPGWKVEKSEPAGISILLGSDGYAFTGIDPQGRTPRSVPNVKRKANAVGASNIDELLSCPFLWQQKRQAELYEPDSGVVSPAEWGVMLHKYWERVWGRYREDMTRPGLTFTHTAKEEWQKLLHASEHEEYGKFTRLVNDPRLTRKLQSLNFRAERLAGVQAKILDGLHEAGYVHTEILLEEEAYLKGNREGVTFLGQCDRIEFLRGPKGEKVAFIADYKEGNSKSSEESMNIAGRSWAGELEKFAHGLQLSVYSALFADEGLSGVYILGLEDGKIAGTIKDDLAAIFRPYESKDKNGKKLGCSIVDRISEGNLAMDCAVEILKAGEFPPYYDSQSCKYCKIKSLCRKGEFRAEVAADSED